MTSGNHWFTEPDRSTTPAVTAAEDTSAPVPLAAPNVGTPLFDELAATYATTAAAAPATSAATAAVSSEAPVPRPCTGSTDAAASSLAPAAAVLDLFTRIKRIEDGDGSWSGGDTVAVLSLWFAEFGIDVSTDATAAARSLRMPARFTSMLTAPTADEPGLIIHVRTDNSSPLDDAHSYLAALVQGLGEQTSAAVFDTAGDQIAHFAY
ncbi:MULTISPECIES: hypothetical protein [Actinosynnema]|uniref:hypothetical protein n=1 Tax=Actinosynnema TaxID=40566 RepID=UPI0020A3ADD4|nr:hypothetical protein [Actinosynnema pretiosum]MCP2097475.1 hypothetical protein [Actinosynnema pretiosum]